MRNIAQYPITTDEVKKHLQSYADQEINSGVIGGTGPYICKLVIDWIDDDPENFESFLRAKQALELDKRNKSAK
jgi:hypothetical protein